MIWASKYIYECMSDANPDKDPDLHPKLMTKPDTDPKKIISNPQLGLPILITEVES